jgi:hypothetical protein
VRSLRAACVVTAHHVTVAMVLASPAAAVGIDN